MDNNKNYKWSPEDKITITGIEYDILQKTISMFEGAPIFAAAGKVRADILKRMIEEGIATEFEFNSETVVDDTPETETAQDMELAVNPS